MAKRELEDPSTTLAGNGLQKSSRASVQLKQSPAGEPLELTSVRLLHISQSRKLFNPVSGKQNKSQERQLAGRPWERRVHTDSQPGTGRALGRVRTDSARMGFTFSDVPLQNFSICTEKMGLITHRGSDLSYSHRFLKLLYVFFIIKNKSHVHDCCDL